MNKHEEQMTLESEMSTLGLIRYRARQQTAKDRSQLWATDAAREYTARLLVTIADRIETRIGMMEGRPGSVPIALEHLKFLESKAAALLTMRSVLNSIVRMRSVTRTSVMIGNEIERESRYHRFRRDYPGLFETIRRRIQSSTSPGYKHKVITHAMTTTGWDRDKWTEELRLRVGAVLLDILINLGIVERKQSLMHHKGAKKGPIIAASVNLKEWLLAYDDYYELLSPQYLPCVVEPKKWVGPLSGGYHGEILDRIPLVKGTSRSYIDSLKNYEMPIVYEGINKLQSVGWSIYTPILSIVEEHWHLSREVGTLPFAEDKPLPPKPKDIDTNRESRVAWKRKAAAIWDVNIRSRSKRIAAMQIITTGRRYGDATFYYPHQLDFRSRVYTVPHPLTVQGSDLCRGLLQFAEAKPIGDLVSAGWLAIHGANCFGYDKESYDDRIKWAQDNTRKIEECAHDPYQNKWWTEADDPWQFLRWTHEWAGFQSDGLDYESSLPISVDQTCSGLQHYAALLKDPVSGASTNLVYSKEPNDIYTDVADAVVSKIKKVKGDPMAAMWLSYQIDRGTLKRIVMTTPYGSRKYSHRTFIVDDINKRQSHPFGDRVPEAAQWLANIVWDTIGEVVVAARDGMNWLRDVARIIVKSGKPIKWVTPIGFPVHQGYESMVSKQVRLSLGDGSSCKSTLKVAAGSSSPDAIRQVNGVAPNVIHSLDATVLLKAVVKAEEIGIDDIGVVHDSFSAHACNVQKLGSVIREAFVEVYSKPVLSDLREQLQSLTDSKLPSLPSMGTLDIAGVLDSPYFAG